MDQFGANTAQYVSAHPWAARRDRSVYLGTRRIEGDMRLNVFHYPIYGWVDAVVLNLLMGRATVIQLGELTRCSYGPLADTITEILPSETRHAELGEEGLRIALSRRRDKTDAQASVNYWYPRVADTFGRAESAHLETVPQIRVAQSLQPGSPRTVADRHRSEARGARTACAGEPFRRRVTPVSRPRTVLEVSCASKAMLKANGSKELAGQPFWPTRSAASPSPRSTARASISPACWIMRAVLAAPLCASSRSISGRSGSRRLPPC